MGSSSRRTFDSVSLSVAQTPLPRPSALTPCSYPAHASAAVRDLHDTLCHRYDPLHRQLFAYAYCLRDYGHRHKFMGAAAADGNRAEQLWRGAPVFHPTAATFCLLTP